MKTREENKEQFANTIKKMIDSEYGNDVCCRIGNSENIQYDIQNKFDYAKYAIYIHLRSNTVCVWDVSRHRNLHGSKVMSLTDKWDTILPNKMLMKTVYKKMRIDSGYQDERVLIMSLDTLAEIYSDLDQYMYPDEGEDGCPEAFKKELKENLVERRRESVTRWNRKACFRWSVLERYNYRCAVCRCDRKELLQAAHIKGVSDGGSDETTNGICLCANHHIMLDKELIQIDWDKNNLSFVDDSVKNMAWYKEYIEQYKNQLHVPNS